jgi:hypothetical protein
MNQNSGDISSSGCPMSGCGLSPQNYKIEMAEAHPA